MELLTAELRHQLSANWIDGQENAEIGQAELDYAPVLKLFTPWAQATWLLTELNEDTGILFGDRKSTRLPVTDQSRMPSSA